MGRWVDSQRKRQNEREREETRHQSPFNPSVASLCHPWFTTTNLSYRFPIFETSATALCGTTGTYLQPSKRIIYLLYKVSYFRLVRKLRHHLRKSSCWSSFPQAHVVLVGGWALPLWKIKSNGSMTFTIYGQIIQSCSTPPISYLSQSVLGYAPFEPFHEVIIYWPFDQCSESEPIINQLSCTNYIPIFLFAKSHIWWTSNKIIN